MKKLDSEALLVESSIVIWWLFGRLHITGIEGNCLSWRKDAIDNFDVCCDRMNMLSVYNQENENNRKI